MTHHISKLSLNRMRTDPIDPEPIKLACEIARIVMEWVAGFFTMEDLSEKFQNFFAGQGLSLSPAESAQVSGGFLFKALASPDFSAEGRDDQSAWDLIADFESFKPHIYLDQGGKPT